MGLRCCSSAAGILEQDFLYADELKAFAADGICELHTAFSRAGEGKTYVQHLVVAQKEKVWRLIEQGAIIYVCGDGGKMEPDVKAALVAIYRERTGADAEAGARWIEETGRQEPLRAGRLGGRVGYRSVIPGRAHGARTRNPEIGLRASPHRDSGSRLSTRPGMTSCHAAFALAPFACVAIASMICGHIAIGVAWPMPSIINSLAPGIEAAVSLPPAGCTSGSMVP